MGTPINTEMKGRIGQVTNNEAVDRFLSMADSSMVETLKELFRGWLSSDDCDSASKHERASRYFDFEQILALVEVLTIEPKR